LFLFDLNGVIILIWLASPQALPAHLKHPKVRKGSEKSSFS